MNRSIIYICKKLKNNSCIVGSHIKLSKREATLLSNYINALNDEIVTKQAKIQVLETTCAVYRKEYNELLNSKETIYE